jgi:hypothetical protein
VRVTPASGNADGGGTNGRAPTNITYGYLAIHVGIENGDSRAIVESSGRSVDGEADENGCAGDGGIIAIGNRDNQRFGRWLTGCDFAMFASDDAKMDFLNLARRGRMVVLSLNRQTCNEDGG